MRQYFDFVNSGEGKFRLLVIESLIEAGISVQVSAMHDFFEFVRSGDGEFRYGAIFSLFKAGIS